MAVITLCSASGSPGVTSTVLGLALTWPRPVVVVEADPTGGSAVLAGYFQGQVQPSDGLVELLLAHRHHRLAETLPGLLIEFPESPVRLLPGIREHAQATSVAGVWEPLVVALRELGATGQDVLVDAGRLGLVGSPAPLIIGADVTALVTDSGLPSLAAARSWAGWLAENRVVIPGRTGLVVVGEGRPYRAAEVTRTLGLPVWGSIDWDPAGARVFSHGDSRPRRFDSSALVRSLRACGDTLRTTTERPYLPRAPFLHALLERVLQERAMGAVR